MEGSQGEQGVQVQKWGGRDGEQESRMKEEEDLGTRRGRD